MADTTETVETETTEASKSTADKIVAAVTDISKRLEDFEKKDEERYDKLEKKIEEASKPNYRYGIPNGNVHGLIKGESPNNSRPFSFMRLGIALAKKAGHEMNWADYAKTEVDICKRLAGAYAAHGYAGEMCAPLATELMPERDTEMADGTTLPGIDVNLIKECRDIMADSMSGFDPDELEWLQKRGHVPIRKDLSANTATTGGTLIAMPAQGELIDLLRGVEVFPRVGAREIDLPPQGQIRFPRVTSGVTIAAYAEGATVSESTPGTGALELAAKAYSGLVDIPDELMKFATSVAVEAWLRGEMVLDLGLQVDSDRIAGAGGTAIQGIINYSGFRTVIASTPGATGDTLDPEDPSRLFADIADQNAPVDRGFFYAMTNTLWGGITTRRLDQGSGAGTGAFAFNVGANQVGGGPIRTVLNGHQVVGSTQIPTDRVKSSNSSLTLLLAGVGSDYMIARAGIIDIAMTNSDDVKFTQRISTMRATQYTDGGPLHENSFGMIDDISNS